MFIHISSKSGLNCFNTFQVIMVIRYFLACFNTFMTLWTLTFSVLNVISPSLHAHPHLIEVWLKSAQWFLIYRANEKTDGGPTENIMARIHKGGLSTNLGLCASWRISTRFYKPDAHKPRFVGPWYLWHRGLRWWRHVKGFNITLLYLKGLNWMLIHRPIQARTQGEGLGVKPPPPHWATFWPARFSNFPESLGNVGPDFKTPPWKNPAYATEPIADSWQVGNLGSWVYGPNFLFF